MEKNIIDELNKLQMEGKTVSELVDYIIHTCCEEEKEYIRYVYHQGGKYMGDSVLIAASLI